MQKLIPLRRGIHDNLLVSPRGLSRRVWISEQAFQMLKQAQQGLPEGVTFVVLRAYEPGSWGRRSLRTAIRKAGSLIFKPTFPSRAEGASDIFCPNGHDIDGNHVDVALSLYGTRLRFLPLNVFTPAALIARGTSDPAIEAAWNALRSSGFQIHRNPTEALQIHCDL